MVVIFTRKLSRIIGLLSLPFVVSLLVPFTVVGEPKTPSCTDAHTQIEQTQKTLKPLKQHQQQLKQHVRTIYQELFVCQTATSLTQTQQQHCSQLQEEGPKQFQAMVKAITLAHHTFQQLAQQTRQVQLICPTMTDGTFSKIASLSPHKKIVINK